MVIAKKHSENEKVQTGVRLDVLQLKVLKGLSEHFELSLGDLLDLIVAHALAGKIAFSETDLKEIVRPLCNIFKHDPGKLIARGKDEA